jgi:hypothetical protein
MIDGIDVEVFGGGKEMVAARYGSMAYVRARGFRGCLSRRFGDI